MIALPAFFMFAGCLLATKDDVRRRPRAGQTVGRLARALFGMHWWSLLLWFALLLAAGFPVAIWIGGLTH